MTETLSQRPRRQRRAAITREQAVKDWRAAKMLNAQQRRTIAAQQRELVVLRRLKRECLKFDHYDAPFECKDKNCIRCLAEKAAAVIA